MCCRVHRITSAVNTSSVCCRVNRVRGDVSSTQSQRGTTQDVCQTQEEPRCAKETPRCSGNKLTRSLMLLNDSTLILLNVDIFRGWLLASFLYRNLSPSLTRHYTEKLPGFKSFLHVMLQEMNVLPSTPEVNEEASTGRSASPDLPPATGNRHTPPMWYNNNSAQRKHAEEKWHILWFMTFI